MIAARTWGVWLAMLTVCPSTCLASDHADPIDPLYLQRQEGAITDLFVFPVLKRDSVRTHEDYRQIVANPYRSGNLPLHAQSDIVREELSTNERADIESIVLILCVRRQLSDTKSLKLEPYEFRLHIDVDSDVKFPTTAEIADNSRASATHDNDGIMSRYPPTSNSHQHQSMSLVESFARYGGQIPNPMSIREDITVSFRLHNDARLTEEGLRFSGSAASNWTADRIRTASGIFDDPFIFPAFFGTNVVGIAIEVPMDLFPADKSDFLIWGTSHKGSKQIDHVGRSLRTQNPRFELLNTLHPSRHVQAITNEHTHPSLMRDILLRANFASLFAFRRWDFVPDVMCFSTRFPSGFPNGRLLTDDVAAILARHGDTLLYELSYQDNNGTWPRQTTNDTRNGTFMATFPYLNPPHLNPMPRPNARLLPSSIAKLIAIGIVVLGVLVVENWFVARLYHRWKLRRRYL